MSGSTMDMNDYKITDERKNVNNMISTDTSENSNALEPAVKIESSLEHMEYGYCDKCQTNLFMLKMHEAVFHKNKEEKRCTICGQLFIKASKLFKHLCQHETNQLRCHYCLKSDFVEFEDLFNHLEEHIFLHIYICHICQKSFALKSNLDDHLTAHSSSWKLPFLECLVCKLRFESRKRGVRMLKNHWLKEHSKEFNCIYCSKKFSKFIVFYSHCLRHTKQLPYVCDICGLNFRKNCRLKEHFEIIHKNKVKYKCPECFKEFKHKPSFDAHVRSHNQSLGFACNYCAKSFLRKVSLLDHFLEKKCTICDEEFYCRTLFDLHFERRHKNDRLFACDECSRSYVLENALKRHKTLVHPKIDENVFRCNQCCYETITRHNLNRHKRRNHPKKCSKSD